MKNLSVIILFCLIAQFTYGQSTVSQRRAGRENQRVNSVIDPQRLDSVREWIKNTRQDLLRTQQYVQTLPLNKQASAIADAFEKISERAKETRSEYLTLNIMDRAKEVYDLLSTSENTPRRETYLRFFMNRSLNWAQGLAPRDSQYMQSPSPMIMAATRDWLLLGLDWAEHTIATSFGSPTNRAHAKLLIKTMGFLYNDILDDQQYNRILAGVAAQFVEKYQRLNEELIRDFVNREKTMSPMAILEVVKSLREFLMNELRVARDAVGKFYLLSATGAIGNYPLVSPVVIPNEVTIWGRIENGCPGNPSRLFTMREGRMATQAESGGQIDGLGFQYIWDKSCNFENAMKVGKAIKQEGITLPTFANVLNFTCVRQPSPGGVSIEQALEISAMIDSGQMSLETVEREYQGSCEVKGITKK